MVLRRVAAVFIAVPLQSKGYQKKKKRQGTGTKYALWIVLLASKSGLGCGINGDNNVDLAGFEH